MTRYEMVFAEDETVPSSVPTAGQTIDIGGVLFDIESVEGGESDCPRLHLTPHGEADVEAHWLRTKPTLAPPTSFEGDLVYTLQDIATQLSTLAASLGAYWSRGAA
jgi:hypothetical protein